MEWDTSRITSFDDMFIGRDDFNENVARWDTSAITTMQSTFYDAAVFNCDISQWDISSTTTMRSMFSGATNFNIDLSNWDVSQVTDFTDFHSVWYGNELSTCNKHLIYESWSAQNGYFEATYPDWKDVASCPPPLPPLPPLPPHFPPSTELHVSTCGPHHNGYYLGDGTYGSGGDPLGEYDLYGNFTDTGNMIYNYVYGYRGYYCGESLNNNCEHVSSCGHWVQLDADISSHHEGSTESVLSVRYSFAEEVVVSRACVTFMNLDETRLFSPINMSIATGLGILLATVQTPTEYDSVHSMQSPFCIVLENVLMNSIIVHYNGWRNQMAADGDGPAIAIRNVQFFSPV